eukprot:1210440-Rhodomonas_salina.1
MSPHGERFASGRIYLYAKLLALTFVELWVSSSVENVGYTFSGGGQAGFSERMITAYSRAVVAIMAH